MDFLMVNQIVQIWEVVLSKEFLLENVNVKKMFLMSKLLFNFLMDMILEIGIIGYMEIILEFIEKKKLLML